MKNLFLLLAFFVPLTLFSQKDPVDKLFEKYGNQEGFTTVNISGKLLGFASESEGEKDDVLEMLSNLEAIRILTVEDEELNKDMDFYKELEGSGFFKNEAYEVLMEVTEKDEVVRFLGKEGSDNMFSELLLVVGGDDNVLISIRGLIDPSNIGKIMNKLDIDLDGDNK
jgi:hypothetical protein